MRDWRSRNRERSLSYALEKHKAYVARNLEIVREAKSHPCADCGNSYPPHVMDLHHVRGDKDRNVSRLVRDAASVKRLTEEIAKCVVICANCHRLRHGESNHELDFEEASG